MSVGIAIVVVSTEKELWHTQKENVELLITFMLVKAFPQLLDVQDVSSLSTRNLHLKCRETEVVNLRTWNSRLL